MFGKRSLFNTTSVPVNEFQEYKHSGFINEYKTEKVIYWFLFLLYNVCSITSLILFYKIRDTPLVRERGFGLTFFGGIVTFINAFIGFIPQLMTVSCPLSVYNANVIHVLVNLIFFCRSFRLILQYYFQGSYGGKANNTKIPYDEKTNEGNIVRKTDRIVYAIIAIPTLIAFIITVGLHAKYYDSCPFFNYKDAILDLKTNNSKELFYTVQIFGGIYMVLSFIMVILLSLVKDANQHGAKFEMLSTCLLIIFSTIFNIILQKTATGGEFEYNGDVNHRRIFLTLFEITKGGKILFELISVYMLFCSITLPVIKHFKDKKNKRSNSSYAEL